METLFGILVMVGLIAAIVLFNRSRSPGSSSRGGDTRFEYHMHNQNMESRDDGNNDDDDDDDD